MGLLRLSGSFKICLNILLYFYFNIFEINCFFNLRELCIGGDYVYISAKLLIFNVYSSNYLVFPDIWYFGFQQIFKHFLSLLLSRIDSIFVNTKPCLSWAKTSIGLIRIKCLFLHGSVLSPYDIFVPIFREVEPLFSFFLKALKQMLYFVQNKLYILVS